MTERRASAAHVFVDDLHDPQLSDDDRHHLERVLRLRVGERVTATDGRGAWCWCEFAASGSLVPVASVERETRERCDLTVLVALAKGDKPETVVQKLTELSIDRIVPFVAERSIVQWNDAKILKNLERWRRVAREAAMQSRQVFATVVDTVQPSLAAAVAHVAPARVALADPSGQPMEDVVASGITAVAIGPEGGFTVDESSVVDDKVALPGGILRAETAAVVAGALLVDRLR